MKLLFQFIIVLFFFGNVTAQQTGDVDFKKIEANLNVSTYSKQVDGMYFVEFEILKDVDSIYLDAKNIKLKSEVWEDSGIKPEFNNNPLERTIASKVSDGKIVFFDKFKAGKKFRFGFRYESIPKKAMYFVDDQIWTQGQGKYTSNWLPSIDDVNDKIEFDLSITYENGYEVLANGKLINRDIGEEFTKWHYDMQNPMSSYLVALAIGKYNKKTETSKSGIPLEYYYYPEDSLKVEPTYRYIKQMFDFLEEEIGFAYPWLNYKQVPVKDFLYSGMENTSLTIFSDGFVVDSIGYNDKNYITVNAHELAHQWFGDLVTATSGAHHWLQEGFATYYALLAERDIFGEDHYYWQLFENAQELIAQEEAGQSTSLLDPKSSSTTFYKKGAWALHVLREQVGDSAFKDAVKVYLNTHQFGNVKTSDFISEVEKTSQQDLSEFVDVWLTSVELPEDAIVKSLKKSEFMREYLSIDCTEYSQKCKDYLVSNISDKAKIKVVSQISKHIEAEAFRNNLQVRQAIAQYVSEIPKEIKQEYESLLNDKSYVTIEAALYNLWVNFPQERIKYLQKTKDIKGFSDYNVRLLWLVLNLNTIEFEPEKKQDILNELIGYSLPEHHFELRMNAFNYLKLIGGFDEKAIKSLLQATKHHNWRFSKFAKELLSQLENEDAYKQLIDKLKNEQD
ncbi:M1 family metallopeptidase [Psychroserpens sp. Hel_I_66]|uniref:M1 family metallopeptidase n=1 Tax=Psychroserpens sp. Hel_I_66 TaxID=1250004 RepID=UPI000648C377|nr:M1 family metallopeptidase [Psychroserpens sp. Hel_I_66]